MTPVSFRFVAAGAANLAKGALYRLDPARTGPAPGWDGRGNPLTASPAASPIASKSFWEGRYALCELVFGRGERERLVMNDAVCSVSLERNIVSTPLAGADGTVKEYSGDGDYRVSITVGVACVKDGLITDDYPEDGMRELLRFFSYKESLNVHSRFLDIFGISSIAVTGFSAAQETASNVQTVSIEALSDNDYDIYSAEY